MVSLREYFEFDPAKKTLQWATEMVTNFRFHMDFLVNPTDAKENMEYLLGQQSLKFVEDLFKDPSQTGIQFIPLKVFDKIRKILISEMENAGIDVGIQCVDPTASADKKKDRQLLAQKNFIEAHLTALQQGIGLPPYSINNAKKDGRPVFKGNVDRFDEMGLNVNNEDDLEFFFKVNHRLRHEIKGEILIRNLIKYNELGRSIPKFMNDILSKNAIALRVNVNEMTGAIDAKYLAPETVKVVLGRREDGKDARAKSYEQTMSVGDALALFGDEFNFQTDMEDLLRAVSYSSQVEFTGVTADGNIRRRDGKLCSIQSFMQQYNVTVGYIEWKTVNATGFKITKSNFHDNPNMIRVNTADDAGSENSKYTRQTFYNEVTYKAYYLSFSPTAQKLYKCGPLPYQTREGSQDEISGFSIIHYKDIGESAVSIGKYFVNLLEKAIKKMDWMMNKAKPPGRAYFYEGLVDLAEKLFDVGNNYEKVNDLIKMFVTNNYELWTLPKDDNGNNIGGSGQANYDIKNGISEACMEFWKIGQELEAKILDQFGMSPLRQAYAPNPRDGYQLQMESLQASRTATQYANRMCMYLFNDMGTIMLSNAQDIIRYREKNSRPYKFLIDLLGYETVDDIDDLQDICFHRYGLFVESLNIMFDRKELMIEANMAFQNKEITYEQLLLIRTIESPKLIMYVIAYAKRKTLRENEQVAQQQSDRIIQQQKVDSDAKLQLEQMKGQNELANTNAEGEWLFKSTKITADTNLEIAKMKLDSKPAEIAAKKDANIEEHEATSVP